MTFIFFHWSLYRFLLFLFQQNPNVIFNILLHLFINDYPPTTELTSSKSFSNCFRHSLRRPSTAFNIFLHLFLRIIHSSPTIFPFLNDPPQTFLRIIIIIIITIQYLFPTMPPVRRSQTTSIHPRFQYHFQYQLHPIPRHPSHPAFRGSAAACFRPLN